MRDRVTYRPHRLLLAAAIAASLLCSRPMTAQLGLSTALGETTLLVPLGVPNPKDIDARLARTPSCTSPDDPNCRENISLAAFRLEVILPAGIAKSLADRGKVLSVAIESERVEYAVVPQSLAPLPARI